MRTRTRLAVAAVAVLTLALTAAVALADSVGPITFEPPTYTVGSIHNQDGWQSSGSAGMGCAPYDHKVAAQSLYPSFGTQSLRMSNAVTSGCFGDQTFSKQLVNEAGETSAQGDGVSGPRQREFKATWRFASAVPGAEQPGLQVVASPDRGDGARMSWVQMKDTPTGLEVNFFDYQDKAPYGGAVGDPAGCGAEDDFVQTTVATGLDRSRPHTIRVTMAFQDGSRNDVVKVYVDGKNKHTGTSWEDYFRYCEGNPTRTVDSILFRTAGVPAPATLGQGFLIDRFSLSSGKAAGKDEGHDDDHGDDRGDHGKVERVTPGKMKGWAFAQETPNGAGMMVHGPGNPPLGKGSAQLQVDSTGGWILAKAAYQGTPLRDFTTLAYSTYRQASVSPAVAIALQFNIDRDLTDANESFQGRLVYEPYYTKPVLTGSWQRWNTQDDAQPGNWWFTRAPQSAPVTGCSIADPCTWSEVLAKFPYAGVHRTFGAVVLKAGGGWVGGFVGNTDALAIGVDGKTTVYDFEPASRDHEHDDEHEDDDEHEHDD